MSEQTASESTPSTLDALDTEIEALRERRRQEKALEDQRIRLRPQLAKRAAALKAKIKPLQTQLTAIEVAIVEIDRGELTDYRLRRPSKRKAKRTETTEGDEQ